MRSVGVWPVLRATGAGVAVALLALLLLVRGLVEVLDPLVAEAARVGAGSLVVFAAAALGGAAGAWQAALAGVPTRRRITLVGAVCPGAACAVASLGLSMSTSVDPGLALLELVMVAAGAGAGAWALPAVARLLTQLRGMRGQSAPEYMGMLVIVGLIVLALVTSGLGSRIGGGVSSTIDTIAGGGGDPAAQAGAPGGHPTRGDGLAATADDDGDGLNNEEEAALGTEPGEPDSDDDGVSDDDELTRGTDPNQGVDPLTEENVGRPWERIGISEEEWRTLEDAVLDEVNPGGLEGLLVGDAAESLTLDENGELTLVPPGAMLFVEDGKLDIAEMQMNGIGGGLVKGLSRLLGAGGKSSSAAIRSVLDKLPASLRTRLAGAGVLRGGTEAAATALPRFAPGRWLPHFEKHAAEFGYRTPVEYLRGARDLVGRGNGVQTFTRANGDRLFYDAARNEFAVLRPNGVLRTYFRPREGSAYWRRETGG